MKDPFDIHKDKFSFLFEELFPSLNWMPTRKIINNGMRIIIPTRKIITRNNKTGCIVHNKVATAVTVRMHEVKV